METSAQDPAYDALDDALARAYGADARPRVFRPLLAWALGGPDPLPRVECYEESDGRAWHYVGARLDSVLARATHRIALGIRVARAKGESQPPAWPADLLQEIARRAVENGEAPVPGDAIDLGRPLGGDDGTLSAVVFAEDPRISAADTRPVTLAHVYGVTADELEAVRAWQCALFVAVVRERDESLVTSPRRRSHREDPSFERRVQLGIDRDGSSFGSARAERLQWERRGADGIRIVVGAAAVPELLRMLRGRIPFGRPFRLEGPAGSVVFWPEDLPDTQKPEDDAAITIESLGGHGGRHAREAPSVARRLRVARASRARARGRGERGARPGRRDPRSPRMTTAIDNPVACPRLAGEPGPDGFVEETLLYRARPREKPKFKTVIDPHEVFGPGSGRTTARTRVHPGAKNGDVALELVLTLDLGKAHFVDRLVCLAKDGGIIAGKLYRELGDVRRKEIDFARSPWTIPAATYPEILIPFLLRGQPFDGARRAMYAWTSDRFMARVYYETRGHSKIEIGGAKRDAVELWMYPDLNDWVRLGSALTRLAKPLLPRYTMFFEPEPPHPLLRFEGSYGPPGAPEVVLELDQ